MCCRQGDPSEEQLPFYARFGVAFVMYVEHHLGLGSGNVTLDMYWNELFLASFMSISNV